MTPEDLRRFDDLVSRYLDGALSAGEVEELNHRIVADPEAASRFASLSRVHGALRESLGAQRIPARRRAFAWRPWILAAAAVALAAVLVWVRASAPTPGLAGQPRVPAPPPSQAPVVERVPDLPPRPMPPAPSRMPEPPPLPPSPPPAPPSPEPSPVPSETPSPSPEPRIPPTRPAMARVLRAGRGTIVRRPDGSKEAARDGGALAADDELVVPEAGTFVVGDSVFAEARGVRVTLHQTDDGPRLILARGELRLDVDPRPARRSLVVETAQARATVKGTHFRLRAAADFTRIDVDRGTVDFTRLADGRSLRVGEGRYATVGAGDRFQDAPQARVLWTSRCDAPSAWTDSGFNRLALKIEDDPRWPGRAHLAIAYECPGSGVWATDYFAANTALTLPREATHVRLWIRPTACEARAQLPLRFGDPDNGWSYTVELTDLLPGRWSLVEIPLDDFNQFWNRRTGSKHDPSVPPPDPKVVRFLQVGAYGANFKADIDDIQLVVVSP